MLWLARQQVVCFLTSSLGTVACRNLNNYRTDVIQALGGVEVLGPDFVTVPDRERPQVLGLF
jgi:hypothetical protein